MKKWLVIFIVVLFACTKDDNSDGDTITPYSPPVKCNISIKACTVQPNDTVYLTWTDTNHTVHEYDINSCLYIHSHYFTRDTILLEYYAFQNDMELYIYINQVLMFDTLFPQTSKGVINYIVREPKI